MLTKKQYQLLQYINRYLNETGYSPSFDEMKVSIGLSSKSGIHRLISALEERGFLKRHHHRARALEVIKLPGEMSSKKTDFNTEFSENPRSPIEDKTVSIPLYGRIAAGLPIEALQDETTYIPIPSSLLSTGEHYALTVAGDSMIESGIIDGDIAIIRRTKRAENGQIVVALIDNQEVTLKKLRQNGNTVALEPANKEYETRLFPSDRVQVQGRLVALFRNY